MARAASAPSPRTRRSTASTSIRRCRTIRGLNSDLNAGREEKLAAEAQFARFASRVPDVRADLPADDASPRSPLIRPAANIEPAAALAYRDVAAAWRNYLAHPQRRAARSCSIGHSQGSLMLQQLIAREIENNPAVAARMKLAIIPGFNVLVPQGKLVGGTFKKTPLCSRPGETGCVISWTSFREKNVPPEGAMFGYADQPGMTVGCVNPALPGSTDWVKLDSYWYARSSCRCRAGRSHGRAKARRRRPICAPKAWSRRSASTTVRAAISRSAPTPIPSDKRTDRIGGEVGMLGMFLPGWGMHLADMREAQGDLIREVGEISARSRTAARPLTLERLGELDRERRRRREHAVLDRVDGLAGDADPLRPARPGSSPWRRALRSGGWRGVQPIAVRAAFEQARS